MFPITRRSFLEVLAAAPQAKPSSVEEVVVVFKQHFDIGYTDLARNVVGYYRTGMIDRALEIVDRSRSVPPDQRFVWTIPGWPLAQILGPGQDPARRRRVVEDYREGYFAAHALPFTTQTEMLDLEPLVRGLGFSSRLARENHKELPRDAKMTDVPSHSWVIPTLLTHAGIDFFHIGCNGASSGPDVPMLFWWEGPDGSRLLTFYSPSYGSSLEPPANWPYRVWLALIHTGDNQGPPKPEEVQHLRQTAAEKMPGVKIRMGRLSDFADAIRKTHPELPVVRGDMPDSWIHGLMSMPPDTKRGENMRPRLAALEALDTLLPGWHVAAPQRPDLASAYESALLYGEHTWGIDSKRFGKRLYGAEWRQAYAAGKYKLADDSYAEHAAYNVKMERIVAPALGSHTSALARAVKAEGSRVAVFNPLPWARGGVIEFPVSGNVPAALRDAVSGEVVPTETDGARLRFVARDVPSMGYRTYVPAASAPAADDLQEEESSGRIANSFFEVRLDPARGALRSIVERKSGRELVDANAPYGFGQYFRETFGTADIKAYVKAYVTVDAPWVAADFGRVDLPESTHRTAVARGMTMTVRRGPVSVSAIMKAPAGEIPHAVELAVTLYSRQPYIDVCWSATDKPPDPWPEAGWLALPFQVSNASFRLGRLGGIMNPAKDQVPGSNFDCYKLTNGMAILDAQERGVGLCPVDAPVVSLERPGGYLFSRGFVPSKPVVFVNLYNNLFGTNFQQWIGGSWSSRVRIWSIDRFDASAGLIVPAREARVAMEAAMVDGPAGKAALSGKGIELSRPGVEVTAFGPNPDGNGLILRLWEQAGQDGACTVTLPAGWKAGPVRQCDLRGRPVGAAVPVRNGRFTVNLGHYAPASFLIG